MNEEHHQAANQLHDAMTELLLSLWDAEADRHPETGQMYDACARAWLAVHAYRQLRPIIPKILLSTVTSKPFK